MAQPKPCVPTPSGQPPAARGDLGDTPFAQLLARLHQHAETGTLLLDCGDRGDAIAIGMEQGLVCAGAGAPEHVSLGPLIVELCGRREGIFAWHQGRDLTLGREPVLHGRYHPFGLLAAAVRAHVCDDLTDALLGRLGTRPLALSKKAELRHYAFNAREKDFVRDLNRYPAPLSALLARAPMSPDEVRRVVYLLLLTRAAVPLSASVQRISGPVRVPQVSTKPPPRKNAGSYSYVNAGRTAPETVSIPSVPARAAAQARELDEELRIGNAELLAPPRQLSPAMRQRWVRMLLDYRRMTTQNHFQLLGVERRADEETVQARYAELVAPFEHESLPLPLAPLQDLARDARARLAQARRTLCDPQARAEYIRELEQARGRGARGRPQSAGSRASAEYDEATRLMAKRLYATALESARRAVALDPDQARHHALCGALIFMTATRSREEQRAGLRHLGQALRLDPDCAMAHHYRGLFLKRAGDVERAISHLQLAAALEPRNLEVARELRLLRARSKAATGTSGLMRRIRDSLLSGD